jgi:protease-4
MKEKLKKIWTATKRINEVFLVIVSLFLIGSVIYFVFFDTTLLEGDCNVANIDISGTITSKGINSFGDSSDLEDMVYSDNLKSQIDNTSSDENIKAILLTINSYGGNTGSAQEISYALEQLNIPIVAVIRSAGTSAGYWIASFADKIYAYDMADVGSIGVTMSYLDETVKNTKDGKFFVSLSSGIFKDTGNPDKLLTEKEKVLVMRDIKDVYDIFVRQVANNRKMSVEKVKLLADGSSMLAGRAKEKGLIDEIGSTYDAIDYLSKVIGEKTKVCESNNKD